MRDEGFNVEVGVDWTNGLIYGGNQFNCGTWMDKMGESEKAHNKGIPGTPRDGSAIEIQGLLKSALRFVNKLHKQGKFEYTKVTKPDGSTISLEDWESLLAENFEKHYYVPKDPNKMINMLLIHQLLIEEEFIKICIIQENHLKIINYDQILLLPCVLP